MRKFGIKFRNYKIGFTLTELLIVVIIIGIVSTLALPMLVKTIEKAKLGEAASNLNLIRTGQKIYYLEFGTYAPNISWLNIEDPNSETGRYFEYSVTSPAAVPPNASDFTAKAARREGKYKDKSCYIDKAGQISADAGYFTP